MSKPVKVVQPNGVVRLQHPDKARALGWKLFVEPEVAPAVVAEAPQAPRKRGRPRKVQVAE